MAQALIDLLREAHPDAILATPGHRGDEVAVVQRERLVEVCRFLKEDPRADMKLLAQIACVDLLTYALDQGILIDVDRWLLQTAVARLRLAVEQLGEATDDSS